MGRHLRVFICDENGEKITNKLRNEKYVDALLTDTCDTCCNELPGLNSYFKRYYGTFTLEELQQYVEHAAKGIPAINLLSAGLNYDDEEVQEMHFLAYVYRKVQRFNEEAGTNFFEVEFTYE